MTKSQSGCSPLEMAKEQMNERIQGDAGEPLRESPARIVEAGIGRVEGLGFGGLETF